LFKRAHRSGIYTNVQRIIRILAVLLTLVLAPLAPAANTRATLLLATETARPGDTVLAAVRLEMNPGWHTYWRNSGESGGPTTIHWQLPPGITAGETLWPVPDKLAEEELTTFIYTEEATLLIPLTLAADLKPGTLELRARISWLECEKLCVPGTASVTTALTIAATNHPSAHAAEIEAARLKLPEPPGVVAFRATWEKPATGDTRPLLLTWSSATKANLTGFFPDAADSFEILPDSELVPADAPGQLQVRLTVKKLDGDWPAKISGVLVEQRNEARQAFEIRAVVGAPDQTTAVGSTVLPRPLALMLLYAFVGGLILNLMPCVLPVIALKILGFVSQAREAPGRVRLLGLVYTAGVIASFLVLAGLVIGLKAAGHRAGWGMQFSNPHFIVALAVLVTLVTLNLFGVFEVTLGGRVMSAAVDAAATGGAPGAFFNGLLTTILATSCTAPVLGTAIGFAFAQPAAIVVLVFLTVALGLASPYVLLSWQPAWLKFLPKPGPWMEKFKVVMGFPMLLTTVWLLNLAATFYGDRTWWLAAFLVLVGLAAWIYGQLAPGNQLRALASAGLVLALNYALVLEGQVHWRDIRSGADESKFKTPVPQGFDWEPWSRDAVAQARASGRPVLVDFTAKWCPNCNLLVKPALQAESVRTKARQVNTVALLADYTDYGREIGEELERFGRAGVPLVLVYPRNATLPPLVLPETPTPGMLVEALEQAGK
jgi:thiol:disulfide interchange protein